MTNPKTLTVVATVMTIVTALLLVLNFVEGRSASRAVLVQKVEQLNGAVVAACAQQKADKEESKAAIDGHESRLQVIEKAYARQEPIMEALARHFQIRLTGE